MVIHPPQLAFWLLDDDSGVTPRLGTKPRSAPDSEDSTLLDAIARGRGCLIRAMQEAEMVACRPQSGTAIGRDWTFYRDC